jgi:hypothetical protein
MSCLVSVSFAAFGKPAAQQTKFIDDAIVVLGEFLRLVVVNRFGDLLNI